MFFPSSLHNEGNCLSVHIRARQPQQIVPFSPLISSSSPSCPLPCSPPIASPYFTFSNVSITAGHKPPRSVCVCASAWGRERERLRRITSKIFPAFYAQMSSLSLSLSPPLMWPVLISGADIAAVPSPLVEKDSFPTEKDALERSHTRTMHTRTRTHTLKHLWTVRGSGG